MNKRYFYIYFGKAYPMHLTGVDKKYHRCRIYTSLHKANRCLDRLNNCKWVEWIDYKRVVEKDNNNG